MDLKIKFQRFLGLYGKTGLVLLAVYPIVIIPMTLYALIGSIGNIIRALITQPWDKLTGNTLHTALNNYFYKVQDLNLKRFGRYGRTNYVAGGNFSLKNWFHVMPLALRTQSKAGTVAMLFIAMIIWVGSWFLIMEPTVMNYAILFLAISSTYFFASFIDGQNYNVLGWMFLPLLFSSLLSQNYVLYAALLFAASFFSFTAIFVFGIITTVFSLYWLNPYLILAIMPAAIKAGIPLLFAISEDAPRKIGGLIGVHGDVKYKRSSNGLPVANTLLAAVSCAFLSVYYLSCGADDALILQCIIIGLFFMNSFISRFADQQTLYILILTVFTFSLIGQELNLLIIAAYILAINPIYYALGYHPLNNPVAPPIRKPINTESFLTKIEILTKHIEKDNRILFLFQNPKNQYSKLFEGYRGFIEPVFYEFQKKHIQIFPDWFFCCEFNKVTDTDLIWWNDDVEMLKDSVNYFNTNYILTYEALLKDWHVTFLSEIERVYIDDAKTYFILYKVDERSHEN